MPLKKDYLLDALSELRDYLRLKHQESGQSSPLICSDTALREIATRKPLKTSDFYAIQGLDTTFVDNYSESFLEIIYQHKNASIHTVGVSKQSQKTLLNYKDRLTNISRRNRNLYATKLSQKTAIDLTQEHLLDALKTFMTSHSNKPLRLTDQKRLSSKESERFYRHLTLLYRNINRFAKETGAYDLHIAYPFVEGLMPKDGFYIKAPLMFFPVRLERKGIDFYLTFNHDKDVNINRDLLLAHHKFNRLEDLKSMPDADQLSFKTVNTVVIPFYEKNHFIFKNTLELPFSGFSTHSPSEQRKMKPGIFEITPTIVLGHYRMHSSKLQEDITTIIENKTYNDLLEELLDQPFQTYDYKTKTAFKIAQLSTIKESHLTYINDLNYTQEKVIQMLKKHDKLVIWGPPGTGKSQTITSMIAQQVENGGNVLIVSEKKVALDVIKNRLGYAAKFALFMDDAQDKQTFYQQIKHYIDPTPPTRTKNNDVDAYNHQIEKTFKKISAMHDAFYTGTSSKDIVDLYSRYLTNQKIKETLFPETVYLRFKETFKTIDIAQFKTLENTFLDLKKLKNILVYTRAIKQYPFILKMNYQLTRSEKTKRTQFYRIFDEFLVTYLNTWWFKKHRVKKAFIRENESAIDYFFPKKKHRVKWLKRIIHDDAFYTLIKNEFHRFELASHQIQKLSKHALKYIDMLIEQSPFKALDNIHRHHHDVFDAFYTGYLELFEAKHPNHVYDMENYRSHIETIERTVQDKKAMVSESFYMTLYQDALNFSNAKRIMDIKHRVQQQRLMSVAQFVQTYQLELFSNIKVWMMTPEVVSEIIPLNFAMFDLVIFDEASQMFVEKAIPTIYRAKKVVIAGDSKQLRPSALGQGRLDMYDPLDDDDIDVAQDAESLLDLARFRYPETILNYHYRSKYEELIEFSNVAFYDGKLIVSPNQTHPKKPPIEYVVCEDGRWENRRNVAEAKKVVEIIQKVIRQKLKPTIGVITFNIQQRNLIEDLLDQEMFNNPRLAKSLEKELNRFDNGEDHSLFIKNIENVQGDERDVIIFSTAYGYNVDGRLLRQFGWLNNEGGQNRLNVAISRAKEKIYLVTSLYPQQFHVEDLKSQGPLYLKAYLEYCYAISNRDQTGIETVLNRLHPSETSRLSEQFTRLHNDVFDRLKKAKLPVKKDIGIGQYTIDFGLTDTDNKSYNLGIICDVNQSNSDDIRNLYYHQEKYLHARGWTIYRLFAPNWYKDPNKEMREIKKLLNT